MECSEANQHLRYSEKNFQERLDGQKNKKKASFTSRHSALAILNNSSNPSQSQILFNIIKKFKFASYTSVENVQR